MNSSENSNDHLLYFGADIREKDHREVIEKLKRAVFEIADPQFFATPNLGGLLRYEENVFLSNLQKEKGLFDYTFKDESNYIFGNPLKISQEEGIFIKVIK